jgi:AcrR family transcriptional regulator
MAKSDPAKRSRPKRRPAFGANERVGSRGAVTHARLLHAGLAVLDAEGYHGTRVEAITERVGCSRPTFYQYFADKADFFFQLAAQVDGELGALVRDCPAIGRSRSSRDALRDWLARFERLRRRYAPVFRFEALLRADPRMARGSEQRMLATGRVLASAVEAPLPTRVPLAVHGALAYGTIAEAFGSASGRVSEEQLVEGAADWLHRCLLGPHPGVNTDGRRRSATTADRADRAGARGSPAAPSDLGPKAARSRARLVEVAREVFGRLGYEGTRVDDVAAAASMSHGTFYRYFSGKEEIFREIATPAVDDVLALLEALPDPRGGLHTWARRLYQTDAIHRGVFAAWAESAAARAVLAPELSAEIEAAAGRALGAREPGDRPVDAWLLLAHVERAPYIVRAYPGFAEPEAITATGEILERGFFARAPAQGGEGSPHGSP